MSVKRPAVFLDRDGTLIREVDYLADASRVVLLDRAPEGLRLLAEAGFLLVVATNQSGVARGWISEDELEQVHARLAALLQAQGVSLAGIYFCPHHPTLGLGPYRTSCDCRKPRPGLLQRAAAALGLDLQHSWTIGDAERDLAAGAALGLPGILVATGKGQAQYDELCARRREPPRFERDLLAAARRILTSRSDAEPPLPEAARVSASESH